MHLRRVFFTGGQRTWRFRHVGLNMEARAQPVAWASTPTPGPATSLPFPGGGMACVPRSQRPETLASSAMKERNHRRVQKEKRKTW